MSKQCAKCSKTVYPTEELKCLDKVWHKGCFKCTTCGMTLNIKNFQGFDRLPYCRAHTPKAKHTNVTDTPEISRVKEATKNQSLATYHEDFEKNYKGTASQVADNLEIMRLKKNQENFSQAAYHERFEKDIKGHKIEVTDDPETLRLLKNQSNISNIAYHEQFEKGIKGHKIEIADDPETMRHLKNKAAFSDAAYHENFEKGIKGHYTQIADDPETMRLLKNQNAFSNVKYQEDYIKSKAGKMPAEGEVEDPRYISQGDQQQYADTQRMPPGAVPDRITAPEDNFNSPYSSRNQGSSVVYSSQGKDREAENASAPVEQNQASRGKPGSITDYDPLNDQYGSIAQGHQPYSAFSGQQWQETVPVSRVQAPDYGNVIPGYSVQGYKVVSQDSESDPPQKLKSNLPLGAFPAVGLIPLSPVSKMADKTKEDEVIAEMEGKDLPLKDEKKMPEVKDADQQAPKNGHSKTGPTRGYGANRQQQQSQQKQQQQAQQQQPTTQSQKTVTLNQPAQPQQQSPQGNRSRIQQVSAQQGQNRGQNQPQSGLQGQQQNQPTRVTLQSQSQPTGFGQQTQQQPHGQAAQVQNQQPGYGAQNQPRQPSYGQQQQQQPTSVQVQPSVNQNQPTMVQSQQGYNPNQSTIVQNQSGYNQKQTTMVQNQPTVVQNQPTMVQNQPTMVQSQPTMVQSQPSHGQQQQQQISQPTYPAQNQQPTMTQNQPSFVQNQPSVNLNPPAPSPNLMTDSFHETDDFADVETEQPPPVSQPPPAPPSSSSGGVYKAMYDYDAADDDEVGFRDGDIIINTEPIDDGWMYGTVQRTGQTGMLPSNYVERIQ